MNKGRGVVVGAVIGFVVALTLGFGYSAASSGANATVAPGDGVASDTWWAAMAAMHDSPWMEQMRERMGPEFAAQCDRLHEQARQQLGDQDRDQIRQHMTDQMREHMSQIGSGGYGPGSGMMGGYGPGAMMGS